MSVQININGADATEALSELAALAKGISSSTPTVPQIQAPVQPAPTMVSPQQAAQAYQQQQPAYTPPVVPTAVPTHPAPGVVPTAPTPAYSMEQLGVAATPLVDAGRAGELTAWLGQRGAAALSQLDPSLYGEFATYLRGLGAAI